MKQSIVQTLATACIGAFITATPFTAVWSQADYPNKPIKYIVPFPPGGTSDVMGRLLADGLSRELGQPVIVENIGGGGGVIGTDRGAKATPDGYTLIQTGVGQNAVAHSFEPKPKYDSINDFVHLSQVHSGPNVLVVNATQPFTTIQELVTHIKKNPGKLDYGYTPASSGHMAMEQFKQTAKLFIVGIPYRGGGPMLTDLIGGQIPMMFINQDVALPHVKSGKLRALAVSSSKRNPLYPDVPTVAESGYPGFEALSWSGISVPKGLPPAVLAKIDAAVSKVMNAPATRQRLESVGFVVPTLGSKPYTDFVAADLARWTKVIKTAGIKE